ncbi:MAG: hypothetical protein U0793_03245 [Gemmataceae bacterium]
MNAASPHAPQRRWPLYTLGALCIAAAIAVGVLAWPRGGDAPTPEAPSKKDGDAASLILPETPWLTRDKEDAVHKAIERGIAHLKDVVAKKSYRLDSGPVFVGFTLLHCGVSPDDPAVQEAMEHLRKSIARDSFTYKIAVSILFLDRYHAARPSPENIRMMRTLALRLMAGQGQDGGWGYNVNLRPTDKDEDVFCGLVRGWSLPGPEAPKEMAAWPVLQFTKGMKPKAPGFRTDNSNTQFATLALWVARRQDIPTDRSLAMVDARYRMWQNGDGSWGYLYTDSSRRDAFACAGLLGLATGHAIGLRTETWDKDEAVLKALRFLGKNVGAKARRDRPGSGPILSIETTAPVCYLYSVERVAMLYGLRTIEGKEWYAWGVDLLLPTQNKDGSWNDNCTPDADTCFALLFLRRANLIQDLTDQLQRRAKS